MASSSSSSSFSPCSSSTKNKTAKVSQIQQTLFQKPSSLQATSLNKRQATVLKKAFELSTLCGIEVCVICYGLDGELKTWPEDREKVKDMARRYSELSETKRSKGRVDLRQFLEKINKDDSKNNKKKKVKSGSSNKYPDWDPRFDNYSVEQLAELIRSLERTQTIMQHRIRAVVESHKQRNMRNTNMADQEQMITTTNAAMNHLQQHSNQVSMYLLNHENGNLSQIPASAFHQAQYLAPLPNSLTMYPNSNVESNSGLLRVQGNGMDEILSTNMVPYNDNSFNNMLPAYNNINTATTNNSVNDFSQQFYQNCNVEDNSGFLGVQETGNNNMNVGDYPGLRWPPQGTGINNMNVGDYPGLRWPPGTGINGLQNMDMYGYNSSINTNLSNQLVQFPTQSSAPVFQYMDWPTQSIRSLYDL